MGICGILMDFHSHLSAARATIGAGGAGGGPVVVGNEPERVFFFFFSFSDFRSVRTPRREIRKEVRGNLMHV